MRTMTFAAGMAAGYVLGAKAGREKYERISAAARQLADQPVVNQTRSVLKDAVQNTGQAAAAKIASLAPKGSDGGPAGMDDEPPTAPAVKNADTPTSKATTASRTATPARPSASAGGVGLNGGPRP